jgi:hypothetical protein
MSEHRGFEPRPHTIDVGCLSGAVGGSPGAQAPSLARSAKGQVHGAIGSDAAARGIRVSHER